jgi:hypothetical protein
MIAESRQQASAPQPTAASMTPPIASSAARSNCASAGQRLDHRGRTIGDDLAHRLSDLRGVEAHHQDRVGAHHRRILHQTVHCLAARVLEQMAVFVDLTAYNRAQPGRDVAAEPTAAGVGVEPVNQSGAPCRLRRACARYRGERSLPAPSRRGGASPDHRYSRSPSARCPR